MPAGLLKQDSQNFSPLSPSKPLNDLPPAHMYIFTPLKRSFYLLAFHGLKKTQVSSHRKALSLRGQERL